MAERPSEGTKRMSLVTMCRALIAAAALAFLITGTRADSAAADASILGFELSPSTTQAGGHPDIHTLIWTGNSATSLTPSSCNCADPKNFIIDSPAGVIADPHAAPQCTASDFGENICPIDSQIGVAKIGFGTETASNFKSFPIPVFNLIPHPNQAGLIGFLAPFISSPIYLAASSRTESDYGLQLSTFDIPHIAPVAVTEVTLWGVPADPVHDPARLGPVGCNSQKIKKPNCEGGERSNAPLAPYLNNPTTCGVPLSASLEVTAYDRDTDTVSNPYPATTGCDQLSFNPSLFAQPTTAQADTASGVDIDLKVPQLQSPTTPSPSEIKATMVTLPEGFSINPSAADGKSACSAAQARVGLREEAAQCPEFSKVGSLTITSSSLPAPMPGYIYLREPEPADPYPLWLVADGFGVHVKLPGSVHADPLTGRLSAVFDNLPQFPFSDFNLHFFGSERGLLATPDRCGIYPVESTFTPWDSALAEQTSTQFFTIDSGPGGSACPNGPRPFNPSFQAGVSDKDAGVHSTFGLDIRRADGDQNLSGLRVTTPPGLSATLKGVPYCPEPSIARLGNPSYSGVVELMSPSCPADSQIGTAVAGAGAGTRPLYVGGKVYLAGPYRGAPISILAVVPAVAGPYDVGIVAVRSAIQVNSTTAQITAVSDTLPEIVGGIPLRTRHVRVSLDRPGFALNPTNCDPLNVDETTFGDEGGVSRARTHFQVANCADLPYGPKLSLGLSGGLNRRGHPAVRATFTAQSGEANTQKVTVALPKGELLDNAHIGNVCTRVQFSADACPAASVLGSATVSTPVLGKPLRGNVYLRSSSHNLPDIVLDLEGQFEIELAGRVDTSKGGALRTSFETAPDVPVSQLVLKLAGGATGLLINSKSLCEKPKKATTKMTGQNGAVVKTKTKLQVNCGKKVRKKR